MSIKKSGWTFGAVMALAMVGCAGAQGGSEDVTAEDLGNGLVQLHTDDAAGEDELPDGTPGESEDAASIDKAANCVYVQWCNEPGPSGTICRLRSGCSYNDATVDECIRDTRAVCGAPVQPWYLF